MVADSGVELTEIGCDGGASDNNFLMQFQADVLGVKLVRPVERESTALGAAYLCCMALGLMTEENITALRMADRVFSPTANEAAENGYKQYKIAVESAIKER